MSGPVQTLAPLTQVQAEEKKVVIENPFQGVKNPPVTVPFVHREDTPEEQEKALTFHVSEYMSEDQLLFVQLPSHLPIVPQKPSKKEQENKDQQKKPSANLDDEENIWTAQFENTLTKVPNGYIGEMIVYASGKTKLKLGNIVLDVRYYIEYINS